MKKFMRISAILLAIVLTLALFACDAAPNKEGMMGEPGGFLDGGAGENWWCVVFPPLCAAEDEDDEALALFDEGEVRLISGSGKIIKFRIIEWFSALRKALI